MSEPKPVSLDVRTAPLIEVFNMIAGLAEALMQRAFKGGLPAQAVADIGAVVSPFLRHLQDIAVYADKKASGVPVPMDHVPCNCKACLEAEAAIAKAMGKVQ